MNFLISGAFFGILLILCGASLIIRVIFNIHIPIFRIFFALLLVYFGIKLLMGGFGCGSHHSDHHVMFDESKITASGETNEYNVLFGKSEIDLRDIKIADGKNAVVKINTVFGGSVILLNPDTAYLIKVDAAFAGAALPDGNTATFGTYTYKSKKFVEGKPYVFVEASTVFGGTQFIEKK